MLPLPPFLGEPPETPLILWGKWLAQGQYRRIYRLMMGHARLCRGPRSSSSGVTGRPWVVVSNMVYFHPYLGN